MKELQRHELITEDTSITIICKIPLKVFAVSLIFTLEFNFHARFFSGELIPLVFGIIKYTS